jgi:hypothetical protein
MAQTITINAIKIKMKKEQAITADQVLPPEKNTAVARNNKIRPTGSNLQVIANKLNKEIAFYKKFENETALRGLRIGVLLVMARADLQYGEWMPWIQKNMSDFGQRQANRLMKLAERFLTETQLDPQSQVLLCESNPEITYKYDRLTMDVVQKVKDWIGDRTQNDLFEKYRIKALAPRPVGGDTTLVNWLRKNGHADLEGTARADLPADVAQEFEAYCEQCQREARANEKAQLLKKYTDAISGVWNEVVKRKTYINIPTGQREYLFGLIVDIHRELKGSFKS